MEWWSSEKDIPYKDLNFNKIINGFVYNCPSSTMEKEKNKIKDCKKGVPKYEIFYKPVSARGKSFRERNINGSLLITILTQIKRPLSKKSSYLRVEQKNNLTIEKSVQETIKNSTLKDPNFELIAFHVHSNMSDTEAIYYYIRNAFAHGSFEVRKSGKEPIYLLESRNKKKIKARMRLKESSLLNYIEYSELSAGQIKKMQKPKKK